MKFGPGDMLREMDGVEVWSLHFEGLVGVEDGRFRIPHAGRCFRPTPSEVRVLWDEYFEQEIGPASQVRAELQEEFGEK